MASPDVRNILTMPGRLVWEPQNLAVAYPHAGSPLGFLERARLVRTEARREIREEAFGQAVTDVVWCGDNWIIGAFLRDYDPDTVSLLFPNVATGSWTQRPAIVGGPGGATNPPGHLASRRSGALLFSPDSPEYVPAVYFPKAIPMTEESVSLSLGLRDEGKIGVVFLALPSPQSAYVAFLRDLSDLV